jgi:fumarylpyruvate hydrolase
MVEFVLAPPEPASVAVVGSQARFPVRRIFCVGRNYAAHTIEMGGDPEREAPFFFTKPADAVVDSGAHIPYPVMTSDVHHEIELVVAIGKAGFDIPEERTFDHVWGYGVGIDLTRRDLQGEAKKAGRPWDWGKAFDNSAPCAPLHPRSGSAHPQSGRIWLKVNGDIRQDADLADLIWNVGEIISICSRSIELRPGDLIYTGTPAGVGPVAAGDVVTGGIAGLGEIELRVG